MARGWESKGVADQFEAGKDRQAELEVSAATTANSRRRQTRLESLRLSRSRLLQQLERATHVAHRQVLLNGLRAIEQEIENISKGSDDRT